MTTTVRNGARLFVAIAAASIFGPATTAADNNFAAEGARMIAVIERHAESAASEVGRDRIDPRVLDVMSRTPRHRFVPEPFRHVAYEDRPLPIGYGQTISQPYIVALMTDLLNIDRGDAVLEIGTGSGYQAAVLAPFADRVCTIEIIPELGARANAVLAHLGYPNVKTKVGDGYYGWPECGPFDGIVVTAAAGHVPPPLIAQLKPGGRMVIPVGGPFALQYLTLVEKLPEGRVHTRQLLPVRFVPLTRQ